MKLVLEIRSSDGATVLQEFRPHPAERLSKDGDWVEFKPVNGMPIETPEAARVVLWLRDEDKPPQTDTAD